MKKCYLLMLGAFFSNAFAGTMQLRLIGEKTFPNQTLTFENTVPGGLSGIDYDPENGLFWVISDDQSVPARGAARFYAMRLDYDQDGFHDFQFESVTAMRDSEGNTFAEGSVDPESIRRSPTGNFFWSSEGIENSDPQINPFVWEMSPEGQFVRAFEIPTRFNPTTRENDGSRHNLVFESLTLSPDGQILYTATEGALRQDGSEATATEGSPSRILALDVASGTPIAEYVYQNEKVVDGAEIFSVNGLVELLALDDSRLLALERSFTIGFGNKVRLYEIDLTGASDVSQMEQLGEGGYVPVKKTLVADLNDLGITLDNLEGMTFGPKLANGNQSLVIVSDDNFGFGGFTQFLVFEVMSNKSTDFWGNGLAQSQNWFRTNWLDGWIWRDAANSLYLVPRLGWVTPLSRGSYNHMFFFSLNEGLLATTPNDWPYVFSYKEGRWQLAGSTPEPLPFLQAPPVLKSAPSNWQPPYLPPERQ